jgi:GT2 family glycosyltransferase
MVSEADELVSVLITTFNSASTLRACLDSLAVQDYPRIELILVDNASIDATRDLLGSAPAKTRVILNPENAGFAAAQNQAIRASRGQWLLSLNPDVVLAPDFISQLVRAVGSDVRLGSACGKLLRWQPGTVEERTTVIDSTGMYFLRNLRHLDRGAEELDRGQYNHMEYVFGASGAAALYRREMVEDVSIAGEFFDQEFFAYREDADLAWRAQILGWRCLYVPSALGWHQRRVTPERREQLPFIINWHSVKNRFLMRAKNISIGLYLRLFFPTTWRDLMIVGYALLRDWRLLSALLYPLKNWQSLMRKRKLIQGKRRISDKELARWYRNRPEAQLVVQLPSLRGSQELAKKI